MGKVYGKVIHEKAYFDQNIVVLKTANQIIGFNLIHRNVNKILLQTDILQLKYKILQRTFNNVLCIIFCQYTVK